MMNGAGLPTMPVNFLSMMPEMRIMKIPTTYIARTMRAEPPKNAPTMTRMMGSLALQGTKEVVMTVMLRF